jgi:hypothetical protein
MERNGKQTTFERGNEALDKCRGGLEAAVLLHKVATQLCETSAHLINETQCRVAKSQYLILQSARFLHPHHFNKESSTQF